MTSAISRGAALAAAAAGAALALRWHLARRRAPKCGAVLTYFAGHGRCEEVRLMLALCGMTWEDRVYLSRDGASYLSSAEHQLKLMRAGVLAMDQTPLLVVDGLHLVQQGAILRHLARRHGYYGGNDAERAQIDILAESMNDWNAVMAISAAIRGVRDRADVAKTAGRYLCRFDRALRSNRAGVAFLVGRRPSFVDVHLFQALDQLSAQGYVDLEREWPALSAYHARFGALPQIAAYMVSGRRLEFPGRGGAPEYYEVARRVIPWVMAPDSAQHPGMLSSAWYFRVAHFEREARQRKARAAASGPARWLDL